MNVILLEDLERPSKGHLAWMVFKGRVLRRQKGLMQIRALGTEVPRTSEGSGREQVPEQNLTSVSEGCGWVPLAVARVQMGRPLCEPMCAFHMSHV